MDRTQKRPGLLAETTGFACTGKDFHIWLQGRQLDRRAVPAVVGRVSSRCARPGAAARRWPEAEGAPR
jgi:hypothetical protein